MNEPDSDRVPLHLELDEADLAHYEARADAAGRTLEAQLVYELAVTRGLCPPDPGDKDACDRRRLFGRIYRMRPLMG